MMLYQTGAIQLHLQSLEVCQHDQLDAMLQDHLWVAGCAQSILPSSQSQSHLEQQHLFLHQLWHILVLLILSVLIQRVCLQYRLAIVGYQLLHRQMSYSLLHPHHFWASVGSHISSITKPPSRLQSLLYQIDLKSYSQMEQDLLQYLHYWMRNQASHILQRFFLQVPWRYFHLWHPFLQRCHRLQIL